MTFDDSGSQVVVILAGNRPSLVTRFSRRFDQTYLYHALHSPHSIPHPTGYQGIGQNSDNQKYVINRKTLDPKVQINTEIQMTKRPRKNGIHGVTLTEINSFKVKTVVLMHNKRPKQ